MDLGAPELLIILVVVLVLFGGKKLPDLARSLGSAKREFQEGANDKSDDTPESKADDKKKA
jgi:sec-independent protein translocase protein TatA